MAVNELTVEWVERDEARLAFQAVKAVRMFVRGKLGISETEQR